MSLSRVPCPEGVLSDSEEDKGPEAVAQQNTTSAWSGKRKQSNEQGGYSSEASSERGERLHSWGGGGYRRAAHDELDKI